MRVLLKSHSRQYWNISIVSGFSNSHNFSTMAESETMSIDTSNELQDDPLQDLPYDKLEDLVETTL